jgi:hypothetical protein
MARHLHTYGQFGQKSVVIEYRWRLGRFAGPLTPMWLDLPQVTTRDVRFRQERLSDWLRTWAVGMFEVSVEGA